MFGRTEAMAYSIFFLVINVFNRDNICLCALMHIIIITWIEDDAGEIGLIGTSIYEFASKRRFISILPPLSKKYFNFFPGT